MEDCNILSIDNKGPLFTWTNKAVGRRIDICFDCFFCNHAALLFWNKIECSTLARHELDHNLLLQCMRVWRFMGRSRFSLSQCGLIMQLFCLILRSFGVI